MENRTCAAFLFDGFADQELALVMACLNRTGTILLETFSTRGGRSPRAVVSGLMPHASLAFYGPGRLRPARCFRVGIDVVISGRRGEPRDLSPGTGCLRPAAGGGCRVGCAFAGRPWSAGYYSPYGALSGVFQPVFVLNTAAILPSASSLV